MKITNIFIEYDGKLVIPLSKVTEEVDFNFLELAVAVARNKEEIKHNPKIMSVEELTKYINSL